MDEPSSKEYAVSFWAPTIDCGGRWAQLLANYYLLFHHDINYYLFIWTCRFISGGKSSIQYSLLQYFLICFVILCPVLWMKPFLLKYFCKLWLNRVCPFMSLSIEHPQWMSQKWHLKVLMSNFYTKQANCSHLHWFGKHKM